MPRVRALTVSATKLRQNRVWAITTVREPPLGAEVEEEGEERGAHHDLGRGERQDDQQVDGGAAVHPVAAERQGDQAAQDRGEHAGDGRHLDALDRARR